MQLNGRRGALSDGYFVGRNMGDSLRAYVSGHFPNVLQIPESCYTELRQVEGGNIC